MTPLLFPVVESSCASLKTLQRPPHRPPVVPHNDPGQNRCFEEFSPGAGFNRVPPLLLCSTLLHFSHQAFSALVLILIIPRRGLWGSKRSFIQRWSLRQLKELEEWLFSGGLKDGERMKECVSGLAFPYHLG